MPTDPDAMWKRGYDGPAPSRPERAAFEHPSPAADGGVPPPVPPVSSQRRRVVIGGAMVATAVVAAAVVVLWADAEIVDEAATSTSITATGSLSAVDAADRGEGVGAPAAAVLASPLDVVGRTGQPFPGAEPRRLPDRVDELWRFRIDTHVGDLDRPAAMTAQVEVIDSRFVVVISGATAFGTQRSTLSVLDAATGEERWAVELLLGPESFGIVGASGSTLMVETSTIERAVIGFDLETGDERWSIIEPTGGSADVGSSAGFEVLAGTVFLARRPTVATNSTVLFDPETGVEVGQLPGEIVGTDHLGTYYIERNGAIGIFDLSSGLGPYATMSLPAEQPGDHVAVVDGAVVLVRDGEMSVSAASVAEFTPASESPESIGEIGSAAEQAGLVHLPGSIANVVPMIGPTMIVSGSGRFVGAELDGDEIRPAWRRDGIAGRTVQSDRGTVILVSQNGGATQALVDGRTGETITVLTMTPGVLDSLEFAGNGVLTRRTSGEGSRLAAIDLDGDEIWSLPGSQPVALGDGLVARVEISTEEAVVVGYGSERSATVAS